MNSSLPASDTAPLTYWGRVPVYATTWLVAVHGVCFALAALAAPLGLGDFLMGLVFSTQGVLESFQVWQLITYAFVPVPLSFWFLVEMILLYFLGQEVEKYLGRRMFLTLYAVLVAVPSFLLMVAGIFGHQAVLAGGSAVHFAVLVAFAATAPGAQIFLGLPAKWVAIGLLVFNSLLLVGGEGWTALLALWADVVTALLFLWACGVHSLQRFHFASTSLTWAKKLGPKVAEAEMVRSAVPRAREMGRGKAGAAASDPLLAIDPILEKISSKGLKSLTPAERQRLEQARAHLLERERSRAGR